MASNPPEKVVIVGGSLSALIHGIMLARTGSYVTILEQSQDPYLLSHMAGVCCGPDVLWFLGRFDLLADQPLGIPSIALQSLDRNGVPRTFLQGKRIMTSWDSLYFRLRANFDGLASAYYPHPPSRPERLFRIAVDGGTESEDTVAVPERAVYKFGKRVENIQEDGAEVSVWYVDTNTGEHAQMNANLVLGADGPNSVVRRICGGMAAARREYAGYVAWRGVVAEDEVSRDVKETFKANITYNMLGKHGHVILYNIPGEQGSIEEGKRYLNFCWYTNVQQGSELASIMTDIDGTEHHTSVAPGKVRPEIWTNQRRIARDVFHQHYLEIMDKIPSPFLHKITDYYSPEVSFMGGKVLLVGDSSTLLRPHIAFSTNQAAYQCKLLEQVMQGKLRISDWTWLVTQFTWLHWLRSKWFGEFFQRPWSSLPTAVQYWVAAIVEKIRYWVGTVPQISR